MDNTLQSAIDLYRSGRLNQAQEILNQLLSENTDNPEIYYYLGSIAFNKDLYEEAIQYLEKAIALDNTQARYYEMLGEALGLKSQNVGMLKGARTLNKVKAAFQKALELDAQSLSAREGLYMIYLFAPGVAGGDMNKAQQMLSEIENLNPAKGHIARGMMLMKQKKMAEVENEFEEAARLGRDDAEIQMRVGRFFLERKNFDKALSFINRFIELKPDDPAGYLAKGEVFSKQDKFDEALEQFNTAIEKDAQNLRAYYQRALLYHNNQQNDLAKKDLEMIVNQKIKHPLKEKAQKLLKEIK